MPTFADFKSLTDSIEKSQDNPAIERWVVGTKELQQELSKRILSLCLYYEQIPADVLSDYAKALIDVLEDEGLKRKIVVSKRINDKLSDLAKALESSGEIAEATSVRKAINVK